ncbi:hypothetical protein BDR06DRAFT_1029804 [Suillus hirtellus]|nr:hypothetical protein BDR06DRAFT_1029804 [Suillus hirtellus]
MSSVIFDPSMLTASPSPSPKPEEHPQDEGNASVNDATLDNATPKEPEETVTNQIHWSWVVTLSAMHVCVRTCPPPGFDLGSALCNAEAVDLASGKAGMKTLTKVVKAWKEKVEESAVTMCLVHIEKEKAKAVEPEKEKVTTAEVIDMGHLCLGKGVHTGCTQTQGGCTGVSKVKMPVPAPAPKAKMPPPVTGLATSSVTDTAPNAGSLDVEIISESTVNEDTTVGSKKIVVQHVKRPLAFCPTPAPKHTYLDLEVQLEESQVEAAQLRIWNAELEVEVVKWKGIVVNMWQHSHVQEVEVMVISNHIYSMGCYWGEKEIMEMLEEKKWVYLEYLF